jgi:hypothetical protein
MTYRVNWVEAAAGRDWGRGSWKAAMGKGREAKDLARADHEDIVMRQKKAT